MLLFFLLESHVFLNHFAVQSYRIDTVAFRPEMIAPIGALLQKRKRSKYPNRCSPFQRAHQFRYRTPRRNLHQQMHVVTLYIQLRHLASQLLAKHHDAFVHFSPNRPLKDPEPVLRYPDHVILTMPNHMRCSCKPAHASFLSVSVVGTTLRMVSA